MYLLNNLGHTENRCGQRFSGKGDIYNLKQVFACPRIQVPFQLTRVLLARRFIKPEGLGGAHSYNSHAPCAQLRSAVTETVKLPLCVPCPRLAPFANTVALKQDLIVVRA